MPRKVSEELMGIYDVAVEAGVPADQFWSMTPREITAAVSAYRRRQGELMRLMWHIGKLAGIAVNNPAAYPALYELAPMDETGDMEQNCRTMTAAMGGEFRKGVKGDDGD